MTKIGIISVEVPKPVIVPIVAAMNVKIEIYKISINYFILGQIHQTENPSSDPLSITGKGSSFYFSLLSSPTILCLQNPQIIRSKITSRRSSSLSCLPMVC
ncbi:MAG: hypothetical protein Q7S98_04045, partial [Deltaproteobacteria bacterium]|nr:hypothetical protein [Deltaproteobacteria bacterium]